MNYDLVIFDSLANLWPVQDENDSGQAISALMPLYGITKAQAAVVLLGHPRKGEATEGRAMRGSGATAAFVDIIVELRRYAPESRTDNRRTLIAYSRYDETPDELVVDYDANGGYRAVGTATDANNWDRIEIVRTILPSCAPGLTVAEIVECWPNGSIPRPGTRTLRADLDEAQELYMVSRTGKGVRGDAHRYYLPNSIPAGSASQESSEIESIPNSIPAGSNSANDRAGNESESALPEAQVRDVGQNCQSVQECQASPASDGIERHHG